MLDFIERLRAKPEHVRRRIAYGTGAGVAGVVAVVWLFALVLSGTFALSNPAPGTSTLAQAPGSDVAGAATQTKSAWSQLLGAVGAAGTQTYSNAAQNDVSNSATPALNVEDAASSTDTASDDDSGPTAGSGGDQTTISF